MGVRWSTRNIDKGLKRIRDNQEYEQKKQSKYKAKRTVYAGVEYDSAKEATQARQFDLARQDPDPEHRVVDVKRQVVYKLGIDGVHLCKYKLDFLVTYASGRVRHIDVKGMKKGVPYDLFTLKKRLMKAIHGIEVEEL